MTTLLSAENPRIEDRMPPEAASPSLLWSTVDLVRACCTHEQYDHWMALHGLPIGSAGIAHYLARATQVFEEQAYAVSWRTTCNEYAARETYADILMASAPLSREELQAAALTSLREARTHQTSV